MFLVILLIANLDAVLQSDNPINFLISQKIETDK